MSYPGAPGSNSSLPPRPPPSKISGFKPAFSATATPPTHTPSSGARGTPYAAPPSYSSAPSYAGAPAHYGAPPSTYQPYAPPPMSSGPGNSYSSQPAYPSYPQQGGGYAQQDYYGAQAAASANSGAPASYSAAPQIRNPFPAPDQARTDDYDPDMAAQIAQWQSAYSKDSKDAGSAAPAGAGGLGRAPGINGAVATGANGTTAYSAEAANRLSEVAANAAAAVASGDKKKTVVRAGGGQKWTDDTLLEWDPAHLRLFVGNLAGETTDESLYKAFSRWKSLQKARVIRDKVTSKSKGFGFVSFSDPDEFFSAAKEMNGKYIQSHPVVVRKSTTEIKPQTVKDKRHPNNKYNKNKNKNKNRSGNGSGGGDAGGREEGFEPSLGPQGGGITKPGQKTKGGLKLLG
ncbi:Uu.00g019880.m01.CDS01 [Anthostomella pinea]|uniref:Uu.00g019880.m01.CDS01 n=1 Tax=Anthostomella pinea TaxID=933095 RepID=A0AAI8VZC9_9PEZI|nr:Uu.00g019880.m01.CDS01 [Anthostomella pinea]